jgi:hypothetical protein
MKKILKNIEAWCAELELLNSTQRPRPLPEFWRRASELGAQLQGVGFQSKRSLDWTFAVLDAFRAVLEAQVPKVAPATYMSNPQVFRNEELIEQLYKLVALCTLWIQEIEARPPMPTNLVAAKIMGITDTLTSRDK